MATDEEGGVGEVFGLGGTGGGCVCVRERERERERESWLG